MSILQQQQLNQPSHALRITTHPTKSNRFRQNHQCISANKSKNSSLFHTNLYSVSYSHISLVSSRKSRIRCCAKDIINVAENPKGRVGFDKKSIDVVTLGNLCVDIVLNVPKLPPNSRDEKYKYMLQLAASNPDESFWEAGGNSNFAIAAARLGLNCRALGELGAEKYGSFLHEVLKDEGISFIQISEANEYLCRNNEGTVLCWVLVDPSQRHSFCSQFDFNIEPAFSWIHKLSCKAEKSIQQSKVLFLNGFAFDELSPELISSAIDCAKDVNTAIFFDPGPRNKSLLNGSPEQRKSLKKILAMSDVLLLTDDEAMSITGIANPILAAKELLQKGHYVKWVVVKMGPRGSIIVTTRGLHYAPAFKVHVADTVGCGDSFAAAVVIGYIRSLPLLTTLTLANAVGGATAMGCGAGRNVATTENVCGLLKDAVINTDSKDFWKKNHLENHFRNLEIVYAKSGDDCLGNFTNAFEFQAVARDALNSLKEGLQEKTRVQEDTFEMAESSC